jgi:hypothetical protein
MKEQLVLFDLKNTCMAATDAGTRCKQNGTRMVQPDSISKKEKKAYGGESHKVCGNHFKQTGNTGDPKNGWAAHPEIIDNKKEDKMDRNSEKVKAHDTSGTLWEAEPKGAKKTKETKHKERYERKNQPTIVCEITFATLTDASTKKRWVMKPEFKVKPRLFTTDRAEIKEAVLKAEARIPNAYFTHVLVKVEDIKLVLTIEGDMLVPHSPKKGVFLVK